MEETRVLLALWGDERVQRQLEGARRNKAIFEDIERQLAAKGYHRTWQQCRVRMKNLISLYRKILNSNNRSGHGRSDFPFYDTLDRLLGTRPASRPTNLLCSSNNPGTPASQPPVPVEAANTVSSGQDEELEPLDDEPEPPPQIHPTITPPGSTSTSASTSTTADESYAELDLPSPSPQSSTSNRSNSTADSTPAIATGVYYMT